MVSNVTNKVQGLGGGRKRKGEGDGVKRNSIELKFGVKKGAALIYCTQILKTQANPTFFFFSFSPGKQQTLNTSQ